MSHKIQYVPGEFSFHFRPNATNIVEKRRTIGKKAVDSFFHLMFLFLDNGHIHYDDIEERLENHKQTQEVINNEFKTKRDFRKNSS